MDSVRWGIIGCGDVTEVKSGPAFNKVPGSSLVAVMRRDAEKAKDYASRHGVQAWYDDAGKLINDPRVNAVYVATPPLFHEQYTMASLLAGKPVYVEKPMALTQAACERMANASEKHNVKISVAHYRRALPLYLKVKEILDSNLIGKPRFINLQTWQSPRSGIIAKSEVNWRVDPSVSGGGIFHDLSPHQLDILIKYFGSVKRASGFSANQAGLYTADDIVSGEMEFTNGIIFKGLWCFSVSPEAAREQCEIAGSEGMISFSFFAGSELSLTIKRGKEIITFENPQHVQQPMIEKVVNYFLGHGPNPCSAMEAGEVMRIMDIFTTQKEPQ